MIKKVIDAKFLEIMRRHHNAVWAIQELDWLIYDKYRYLYDILNEDEQQDVNDYIAALKLLHGGR